MNSKTSDLMRIFLKIPNWHVTGEVDKYLAWRNLTDCKFLKLNGIVWIWLKEVSSPILFQISVEYAFAPLFYFEVYYCFCLHRGCVEWWGNVALRKSVSLFRK